MNNKETCLIFAQVYYSEHKLRKQQIFIKCIRFKLSADASSTMRALSGVCTDFRLYTLLVQEQLAHVSSSIVEPASGKRALLAPNKGQGA